MEALKIYLRKVFYIFQKELLATIKDPKSAAVLVVPVILQCFVFGYVANYNLENVPYVVVDHSKSAVSRDVLARLDGSGIFHKLAELDNENQIAEFIDKGDALVALSFEHEFARKIEHGETAKLQVIADGRNSTTAGSAIGYISSIVSAYNAKLNSASSAVTIKTRVWYNENELSQWTFLASLMPILCLTQILVLAGLCVARERENGTFDQLLVTPLTSMQIMLGKALSPMLIGLVQGLVALGICRLWFKLPLQGSFWLLIFTLLLFMLSIVGIGLCVSAVSSTMQQVMVYVMVIMLPMNLLSGLSTPVSNMPELLQYFTYINPLRFAIDAVRRIYLAGATFSELSMDFIPMLCVAVLTLPVATWLFRNKLS